MDTRRGLLKLIGLAPAVAGTTAAELSRAMAAPGVEATLALNSVKDAVGLDDMVSGVKPPGFSLFGEEGVDKIKDLIRAHDDNKCRSDMLRTNGLEQDIHAMRSVSAVNKYRKQADRDRELELLVQKARRLVWW